MNNPCINTDRELWRDPESQDLRIFVTENGNIGITNGAYGYVMNIKQWHQMAYEKNGKKLECGKCGDVDIVSFGSLRSFCQQCGEPYVTEEQAYGTDCRLGGACE